MRILAAIVAALAVAMALGVEEAPAPPPQTVTICHAAGQAGTLTFVTLTLPYNAVYGQAGHFLEPGTPNAGHEQDYEGACDEDPPPPDIEVRAGVTATQPTCENQGLAALVFQRLDAIDYDVEGTVAPGETVSVTATGLLGFLLLGPTEFEFTFDTFDAASCREPPPPGKVRVCDPDTGKVITVPEENEGDYLPVGDPACDDDDPPPPCAGGNCTPDPPCVAGETDQSGTCGELPHTGYDTRKLGGLGAIVGAMLLASGLWFARKRI